jgi:hypothetical protein
MTTGRKLWRKVNVDPTARRRRSLRSALAPSGVLCVVLLFMFVTAFTGFPGPGVLKRYSLHELNVLSDHINHSSGFIGSYPPSTPARSGVDVLRSRVWVEGTVPCGVLLADDIGMLRDKPVEGPCGDI